MGLIVPFFPLLSFMINTQTIKERTQAMLALRERPKSDLTRKRLDEVKWVAKEDLNKFKERISDVPKRTYANGETIYRTSKRNRTMLNNKCWFFKKPELNSLTVEQCIETYPRNFIWAYENLAINWSEHVVSLIKQRYPWAVRKIKEPFNF
jgi:hypothetical protein